MRTIQNPILYGRTPRLSLTGTLRDAFLAIDHRLAVWQTRRHERRQLQLMPDYLLRDVGLSEEKAREEASKPFWRA